MKKYKNIEKYILIFNNIKVKNINNYMNNVLTQQNKAFLWNFLYENKLFENIPNNKLEEIKYLFENTINIVVPKLNNKNSLIDNNKIIIQELINEIKKYKEQLILPLHTKDILLSTKSQNFNDNLEKHSKSLQEFTKQKQPEPLNFSDKIDEPMNDDEMNNILEKIQKERNLLINNDISNNNIINENEKTNIPILKISNIEDILDNNLKIEEIEINNKNKILNKINNIEKLIFELKNEIDLYI